MTRASAPPEPRAVAAEPPEEVDRLRTLSQGLLERTRQLELALESRIVIEQAKGMLAERYAVDVGDAFGLLRGAARSNQLKLRDLAASVVASRQTPEPIAAELRRRGERAGAAIRA